MEEFAHKSVHVMYCDIHGIPRGKILSAEYFSQNWQKGARFCCGNFGKDVTGQPVSNLNILWERNGGDNVVIPDSSTLVTHPSRADTALVIGDVFKDESTPLDISPRHILKQAIALMDGLKLTAFIGPELEFHVLDKHFNPVTNGNHAYSTQQLQLVGGFVEQALQSLHIMGIEVESCCHENDPGMVEITLKYQDALTIADNIFLTRLILKELAIQHQLHVTFMPKPRQDMGNAVCHMNFSLADKRHGRNIFDSTGSQPNEVMQQCIAGLLHCFDDFQSIFLPSVNAFKLFATQDDVFVSSTKSWGMDNRSVALRCPDNNRIEHRLPAADCNPYLAIAAIIIGAYVGMDNKLTPQPMVNGRAFLEHGLPLIEPDFLKALQHFSSGQVSNQYFGGKFVEVYRQVKLSEYKAYSQSISDWERETYSTLL